MSFAIEGIDHVEVFVRHIDAAARWYGQVLGLRRIGGWDPEPVLIGAGNGCLALFQARSEGPNNSDDARQPAIRWRRVAWRTNHQDFAAAQQHLRSNNVDFKGPIDHGGSWSIYFEDPDGNPLEITCDMPDSG